MPVSNVDVGHVVGILAAHRRRARYGVLGAALSRRVGNPNARPGNYGNATVTMLNTFFGGMCPAASWVVNDSGYPEGYGNPLNHLYDPAWSLSTPLHDDMDELLQWLDANSPGWDVNLQSTYP